jgi:hypothetical protein
VIELAEPRAKAAGRHDPLAREMRAAAPSFSLLRERVSPNLQCPHDGRLLGRAPTKRATFEECVTGCPRWRVCVRVSRNVDGGPHPVGDTVRMAQLGIEAWCLPSL